MFTAARFVHTEKAFKSEPSDGKAGKSGRRNECGRSRNNFHVDSFFTAERNQVFARVGNGGHSRIGNKSAGFAGNYSLGNNFAFFTAIMLKITDHGLFDFKMVKEFERNPCVLGGDEVAFFKRFNCTGRKIAEVSDWCSDNKKFSAHCFFSL